MGLVVWFSDLGFGVFDFVRCVGFVCDCGFCPLWVGMISVCCPSGFGFGFLVCGIRCLTFEFDVLLILVYSVLILV